MQEILVQLDLSAEEFRKYYVGGVYFIQARSMDGRVVRFPADAMRPHVGHDGVHGLFRLEFDAQQRLIACHRVETNET